MGRAVSRRTNLFRLPRRLSFTLQRCMRIGLHLTLMTLGEFTGFVVGVLALLVLLPEEFRSAAAPFYLVLLFGGAVVGTLGMRWLLGRIAARCPRCGGRAFPQGTRPISYHCRECGHIHETRVRSNW
jgi:hypothetical protein